MATMTERPDLGLETTSPQRGDRFVGTGLLLLAALFVGVQILAGAVIPPLAVPALIYAAAGAVALRRAPRWLLIAVPVVLVLHVVTSIPFLAEALAHPETPASFLPDAYIVVVVVAVVAAAVAGLLGLGHRHRLGFGAAAVAVGLTVFSAVATSGVDSDLRQPDDVPIEAVRTAFPERVGIPAGGAVLWVDNQDAYRHTIVIEGTDVHAELPGSTAVRVETDLPPGTYRYFCDVPGHENMEGEIIAR